MANHASLADSFKTIFEAKAGKEYNAIRSDIGTENEIPNIQTRVSEIVVGLVTNLLSTLENNFKDSDKDVKDACINTFACWCHAVKGTVLLALYGRQSFIWLLFHVFPLFFLSRSPRKGFLPHSCGVVLLWYANALLLQERYSFSDGHSVFKVQLIDELP